MKDYFKYLLFTAMLFSGNFLLFAEDTEEKYRSGYRSLISFSPDNPYLPFLILAGVVLAIISFYAPRIGLIVMLFFILIATDVPIGKSAGMERSVTIRLEDIILLIVSGGWLLNRAKTKTLSALKNSPLIRPILTMATVIVLATLVGYFQDTVRPLNGIFFAMKRLEYFWIFFMTFNLMEKDSEAETSLNILLVVSVVIAVIGVVQFFFFPLSELSGGGSTSTAGFGRANTMGDFLLMMVGLCLGLFLYTKDPRKNLFYMGLLIIFSISLIMTKSRGAYISVPPMLLVIFGISRNKKILLFVLLCVMVALLYIFVVKMGTGGVAELLNKHHEDITSQFTQIADVAAEGESIDPSLHSRVLAWRESVNEISDYPFLGQGCGSKSLGFADNQYVMEVLETGFIGILCFIYMNLAIFYFMLRFYFTTSNPHFKALAIGFMGGHAGMMVHGITMVNFYTIFNMEIFWFVLALISLFYYNESRNKHAVNETAEAGYGQKIQ